MQCVVTDREFPHMVDDRHLKLNIGKPKSLRWTSTVSNMIVDVKKASNSKHGCLTHILNPATQFMHSNLSVFINYGVK